MTTAMLAYCRRCDLAFCPEHLDNHIPHEGQPDQVPTRAEAARVGAGFCAQCVGLFRPPAPAAPVARVPAPLWACTDNHQHPCNLPGYRGEACEVLPLAQGFAAAHHCCDNSLKVFTEALESVVDIGRELKDAAYERVPGFIYREGIAAFWIGLNLNPEPGEKYFTELVGESFCSDDLREVARPLWHFIRENCR